MCHRNAQLLQERRLYRYASWIHRYPERHQIRRCDSAQPVGTPSRNEIQRSSVHHPESRRGCLLLKGAGYTVSGGVNAPYIWLKTPGNMTSWEFFDHLLADANVVGTPGSGFGPSGEGYFRLTAFGTYENTVAAIKRIKEM